MNNWLDALKTILGIPLDDTSQDAAILLLANIAMGIIRDQTGRQFIQGDYLETIPTPTKVNFLTERPINSVESVTWGEGGTPLDVSQYSVNPITGTLTLRNYSDCGCHWDCCGVPLYVRYNANEELPPPWVTLIVADAVRSGLAVTEVQNQYGFFAKKVAVTDVGSVELGTVGETPSLAIQATVTSGLDAYLGPMFAASPSCCGGYQSSELVGVGP